MLGQEIEADVSLTRAQLDVTDRQAVSEAISRDDIVINCAAWTDVDGAEEHEEEALRVNRDGARNLAEAAGRILYVSTDYVFDGTKREPYVESDPVNPMTAYGRTKLAGERAARERHPEGVRVARTAWLYGAGGRNFVDTMRRLGAERDEVEVVDDQTGSPTWTRDLAPALEALLDRPPGVYHCAGAGRVTWAGLARAVFEETGCRCRVRPVSTEALGRPAPRPRCSALASTRPGAPRLRDWREALADYLEETV
jgi:dTDP-4-dehydrorhamnose reductase